MVARCLSVELASYRGTPQVRHIEGDSRFSALLSYNPVSQLTSVLALTITDITIVNRPVWFSKVHFYRYLLNKYIVLSNDSMYIVCV